MGKKSKRQRSRQPKQQQQQQQHRPSPEQGDGTAATKKTRHDNDNGTTATNTTRTPEVETKENLRFEDPFGDKLIEETDVIDGNDDEDDEEDEEIDVDDDDDDDDKPRGGGGDDVNHDNVELIQSWHPLMGLPNEDQELEMDPTAYKMYHTLSPEWPSLSFDLLRDNLGENRQRFPHSVQAVIGTQADEASRNQLTVLKLSDLSRLPQAKDEEEDILGDEYDNNAKDDDDDDSDDDSDEDEDLDLDPILEHYSLPHYGGVNRVRAMPQQNDIVATWSDVGKVYLYNIEELRSRFAASEGNFSNGQKPVVQTGPFFTYTGHGNTEGFALDWSKVQRGYLASGDNVGSIHLWTPREGGAAGSSTGYQIAPTYDAATQSGTTITGSDVSIEDIQWSPTEATVLCAAEGGSGGYVGVYDTRAPHRAMLRPCLHPKTDVNVASWNHLVSNLLATGGDDGTLCVWDLRHFGGSGKKPEPLARFSCHKTPVTSCEWHPTDESMLAMSDEVGTYIYDLSVEEDTAPSSSSTTQTLVADIPPQLLFCHSGSRQFKEMHWHPQIRSCLMTTAYSGFSVFIPSNL